MEFLINLEIAGSEKNRRLELGIATLARLADKTDLHRWRRYEVYF